MKLADAIANKKKSKLFVSLALKPGSTGETFYNTLFEHHNIDAEYVACRSENISDDIRMVKADCAGASVTMPYKSLVGEFVNTWHCDFGPVNTLLVKDHQLHAYNCDYLGLQDEIVTLIANKKINILGGGAMSMNVQQLASKVNAEFTVYSRKKNNWNLRHEHCEVLINTTNIGMSAGECPVNYVTYPQIVIDCVIGNTDLITSAKDAKLEIIKGSQIYIAQFLHQFEIYTGCRPDRDRVQHLAKKVFND